MGRLEDIIARNKRPTKSRERLWVGIGISACVLLILGLMVFTDLGTPPQPDRPVVKPEPGRVNDVYIRRTPARDAGMNR